MRTLGSVKPTAEQARVIDNDAPGFWLIRGAAGSGKTTTALLRLRFLVRYWRDRREDLGLARPVRVLVLTFNRTLRGYVEELAHQQIAAGPEIELEITTFAAWAKRLLGRVAVLEADPRNARLAQLAASDFAWEPSFLSDEVDYVLGRWLPEGREEYLSATRHGRGRPNLGEPVRRRLLTQVIEPYEAWKTERGVVDWSDLAVELAHRTLTRPYDVVMVDETQDFSANQVRAIVNHLADEFVCTFVRDTTQRIYPSCFVWRDVGVEIPGTRSRRLRTNYRNTRQIAAFARPLVDGIETVEDEALPDFEDCDREGPVPTVVRGPYFAQLDWAIRYLGGADVEPDETVAFLHPRGGGWFSDLRARLNADQLAWVSLTREAEWPRGDERIALSTMHSAKGLEFDHVVILGYNAAVVRHGDEPGDAQLDAHRRLLAMALGRARRSVVVGYKPTDASRLVDFLAAGTYRQVDL